MASELLPLTSGSACCVSSEIDPPVESLAIRCRVGKSGEPPLAITSERSSWQALSRVRGAGALATTGAGSTVTNMEFEIWASDSGNLLLVTPDLNEALAWALDYWLREGNDALDALSIGDEQDQWVLAGQPLRALLHSRLWDVPARWATSASDSLQDVPTLQPALVA
jgi:hypothetical protein